MKKELKGQVALSKLIFTHNWEDPAMDEKALQLKPGATVLTITSGGCNTLGFLRFDLAEIFCVDINPSQTYLMELKQAAFRHLGYEEMLGFFGIREHHDRLHVFNSLSKDLSEEARTFWQGQTSILKKGIIMNGRYERFVKLASRILRLIQGSRKTHNLFTLDSLTEQKQFYEQQWNNARWRFIFRAMFNKKSLAKKGLNADYFHFDDGSTSFSESFQNRAGHAISDLPVQDNYFLSLYLLGHYLNETSLPAYLMPENFSLIKANIDRIIPVTADSKYWLDSQPENKFDAMALSNICELMDATDTDKLFSEVLRTSKPGAKLVFRNLMIPREVPERLREQIVKNEALSKEIQFQDRSFVYGKVAAYEVVK